MSLPNFKYSRSSYASRGNRTSVDSLYSLLYVWTMFTLKQLYPLYARIVKRSIHYQGCYGDEYNHIYFVLFVRSVILYVSLQNKRVSLIIRFNFLLYVNKCTTLIFFNFVLSKSILAKLLKCICPRQTRHKTSRRQTIPSITISFYIHKACIAYPSFNICL